MNQQNIVPPLNQTVNKYNRYPVFSLYSLISSVLVYIIWISTPKVLYSFNIDYGTIVIIQSVIVIIGIYFAFVGMTKSIISKQKILSMICMLFFIIELLYLLFAILVTYFLY